MKYGPIAAILTSTCAVIISQTKWEPTKRWLETPKAIKRPTKGYVPDEATAVQIGEAVIAGQFGKPWVEDGKPFRAKLFGDVWVVYSSFEARNKDGIPNLGGPTTVEVSRTNGSILGTYIRQ